MYRMTIALIVLTLISCTPLDDQYEDPALPEPNVSHPADGVPDLSSVNETHCVVLSERSVIDAPGSTNVSVWMLIPERPIMIFVICDDRTNIAWTALTSFFSLNHSEVNMIRSQCTYHESQNGTVRIVAGMGLGTECSTQIEVR
ncbi:MAG: hypothetical protein ACMXYM_04115 [Candidatus Woesearchaeota archaeon]